MRFLRNVSIGIKVLIPSFILILALAIVSTMAVYGLNQQRATLRAVNAIALKKITLVHEFIALSEQVQSDVFRISVLSFMHLPEEQIQPVHQRLEQGLNDLNVIYGQILIQWSLDDTEREMLQRMKEPMEAFTHEAQQAVVAVSDNPSLGVLLVRSSTVPFAEFRAMLGEFLDYQHTRIVQARAESDRSIGRINTLIISLSLTIALLGMLAAVSIGSRRIARPIRSLTELMGRLADGDLSIEVSDLDRRDEVGAMSRAVEVFRTNAIEKAQAQAALQASEANYRAIFNAANDAIFVQDIETGHVLDTNEKMLQMYGYSAAESRGLTVGNLSSGEPPYTQEAALQWMAKAAAGNPQIFEWQARDRGGRLFWVEVSLRKAHIGGEDRLLAVVRDTTERRQMEDQILQARKMETVGQMAAGLAHNFNNLLTGVNGFAELLQMELQPTDPRQEMVGRILNSGQKAARMVSMLLAFARKQMIQPHSVNLNDVVSGLANRWGQECSADITVETNLAPDLWQVWVDPQQSEQTVLNLLQHLCDTWPASGKVTIATGNRTVSGPAESQNSELQPGDYVWLSVSNTGPIHSPEVQKRMFEPFYFTTETVAPEVGLRLAAVHGIVKQNNGHIWVDSVPDEGTTFNVWLPRFEPEGAANV